MISNLTIRSNLIEGLTRPSGVQERSQRMNAPLARISAQDLEELDQLSAYPSHFFDTRNLQRGIDGLPTSEQREQWVSYLFYGDKTVSMKEEERLCKPWVEMAEGVLATWDEMESHIDVELSMEYLCIFEAVKHCLSDRTDLASIELIRQIDTVSALICRFLEGRGIHKNVQHDRVYRILGLSDW